MYLILLVALTHFKKRKKEKKSSVLFHNKFILNSHALFAKDYCSISFCLSLLISEGRNSDNIYICFFIFAVILIDRR